MSNRSRILFLALSVATLGAPSAARAQGRRAVSDSLLQRVRVLDSLMIVQSRAVDSARRSFVRPLPPVEIVRGPVRVRTDSTLAPRVQAAVDSAAVLINRRASNTLRDRIAARVLMVSPDSAPSIFAMHRVVTLSADTARRWSVGRIQVAGNPSAARLAAGLTTLIEQISMQGMDSAFAAWVMVGRAPLVPATDAEATDAYIELATTESAAVRRCRSRDLASCLDVLGLDSLSANRLERWYTPDDYRALLRAVAPPRDDSVGVSAWLRCRDNRDQSGCRIAAAALSNDRVPLPLSASARQGFLREVLDAGGPGAFDRLVTDTGSVRVRLALAAGQPLETIVARWLTRVEASRPDRMRPPTGLILASLGWSGAILALALIRRTSWA